MNARELKAMCKAINRLPAVWSVKAEKLTGYLKDKMVFFEESGNNEDWKATIGIEDENKIATVRYDGGLRIVFKRLSTRRNATCA